MEMHSLIKYQNFLLILNYLSITTVQHTSVTEFHRTEVQREKARKIPCLIVTLRISYLEYLVLLRGSDDP